MLKKGVILLSLFWGISTFAQTKVSGVVTAQDSNRVIKDVEIYDKNGNILATTDGFGFFNFTTQKKKEKLIFYVQNYHMLEKNVDYSVQNKLDIKLLPFSEMLSEVVVKAQKRKLFALKQLKSVEGTSIFAGKKSEVILMSELVGNRATNNARQIYSQVVGLNIYENDDAGLQLNIGGRGLDPNRTANFNTRQNGYDMSADVLGYPESYYTPPSDALSEIQVVRGAASLQYGTQFGGLLNFKFVTPPKDKTFELVTRQSAGSNGLFNTFNSVAGTVGKTNYYGYINYKRGDGFRPNSKFKSFNLHAHLTHQFTKKTALTVELSYLDYLAQQAGGLTDTQFHKSIFFSNRPRNWFDVKWNLWALKFKHDFSEDTKFTFNLFGLQSSRKSLGYRVLPITKEDFYEDGYYLEPRDLIDGRYRNWGIETRFLSKYKLFGKKHTYLVGLKYYQANNAESQGAGSYGTDADFKYTVPRKDFASDFKFPNRNVAFFAENIFKLSDKLSITPGARLEYIKTESIGTYTKYLASIDQTDYYNDNRINERNFALFGIGFSYKHNRFIEMYGNISQNYRSVTFNDIRTVSPSFVVDENIGDENGATADLGIRGKYKSYFSYDIGGFALRYNERIGEVIVSNAMINFNKSLQGHAGDRMRTNIGDALIYGFEGFTTFNWAKIIGIKSKDVILTNFVNVALTDSQYQTSKQVGIEGNKVEFIPFMNIKTGFKIGYKNWLSSLQFTHLSEQFTEATNARPEEKGAVREGIVGEIPAYSILDASLSYKYKKWKFETGINNLLDECYFTRRATGYPGPGIIPSAPRTWFATIEFKW